jgi:hypothetical protein
LYTVPNKLISNDSQEKEQAVLEADRTEADLRARLAGAERQAREHAEASRDSARREQERERQAREMEAALQERARKIESLTEEVHVAMARARTAEEAGACAAARSPSGKGGGDGADGADGGGDGGCHEGGGAGAGAGAGGGVELRLRERVELLEGALQEEQALNGSTVATLSRCNQRFSREVRESERRRRHPDPTTTHGITGTTVITALTVTACHTSHAERAPPSAHPCALIARVVDSDPCTPLLSLKVYTDSHCL